MSDTSSTNPNPENAHDGQNIKIITVDDDDGDGDFSWRQGRHRQGRQRRRQNDSGRVWHDIFDTVVVTFLTLVYFMRPIHVLAVTLPMVYHWCMEEPIVPSYLFPGLVVASIICGVSLIFSVQQCPSPFWTTLLLGSVLFYFDTFDEIQENTPININESIKADGKRYIFACQPHGVVPFAGIAWSLRQAQRSSQPYGSIQRHRRRKSTGVAKTTTSSSNDQPVPGEKQGQTIHGRSTTSAMSSPSEMIPIVVARTVLLTPILKHTMGMLGCVSIQQMKQRLLLPSPQMATTRTTPTTTTTTTTTTTVETTSNGDDVLQMQRRKHPRTNKEPEVKDQSSTNGYQNIAPSTSCVRLYVGSATDVFHCTDKVETIELSKRKKFIQVAMQTGADVVPCFEFGNTTVLNVWRNSWILIQISRWVQFPVSYVWGRYLLPVPKRRKLLIVTGQPIGVPHLTRPRQHQIDEYHAKYCNEVKRLFDTYKGRVPDYKHKKLVIT